MWDINCPVKWYKWDIPIKMLQQQLDTVLEGFNPTKISEFSPSSTIYFPKTLREMVNKSSELAGLDVINEEIGCFNA